MIGVQVCLLLTICCACLTTGAVGGGVGYRQQQQQLQQHQLHHQLRDSSSVLIRNRRFILSWLIHSWAPILRSTITEDKVQSQQDSASPKYNQRVQDDSTVHLEPTNEVAPLDLSRDTRVNYMDGRGRTASLARESDAEVFDWELLQEDRRRNMGLGNPNYYESNTINGGGRSASYVVRMRPVSGVLAMEGTGRWTPQRLNRFNRFPIAYDQSQEFANLNLRRSQRSYRSTRL